MCCCADEEAASETDSAASGASAAPTAFIPAATPLMALAESTFRQVTEHTAFEGIMLAPGTGAPPLPAAAARAQLPLVSALPLVECDSSGKHVRCHGPCEARQSTLIHCSACSAGTCLHAAARLPHALGAHSLWFYQRHVPHQMHKSGLRSKADDFRAGWQRTESH